VLGYNYPGDGWYADAYKLLTSKGLRPAVVPKKGGRSLIHLPFIHDKKNTVKPPQPPESNVVAATADQTKKKKLFSLPLGDKKATPATPAPEAEPKAN
jgi:outer membrane protein assembly factor BamD